MEDLPEINKKINVNFILNTFFGHLSSTKKFYHTKTLTVLIKSFGGSFIVGGILRLLNDILLYMTPLVFRKIIQTIENDEPVWQGYFWVVLLFLTATVQVTISNHYFRQTYVTAFQMRTAVICAVYRKTLTIANHARRKFTSGEITNLMSIDAQRFIEIVPFLNTVWSGPFQFALAIYFLYDLIGLSALAGLAVFGILVPINIYGGKYGRTIQVAQMKAKDERILLMNEVLQGVKVLKLYAWEKPFMEKIRECRDREIKCLKQSALLNALLFVTYTGAPLLVTLVTFSIYVFADENNVLTAEKVFGTVAVFNVVRIPMNQFPRFLMESVKLFVSLRRIDDFLSCEDIEEAGGANEDHVNESFLDTEKDNGVGSPETKSSIEFRNASFSWSKGDNKNTLNNLNLNIRRGELVAVVGKIGSGKSSLLSAIMGEMVQSQGLKETRGSVSFVSQQAWIQNMTVQDNITFGKPLDVKKYEQVLDSCALLSDLEILPSGDQTEIGENGVNLSGGQKQRVSLARAAYHGAEMVLMDDPLSAVDAHVGKHLFDKLISNTGLLAGRTRVLVTHNLSYLHRVDRILVMEEGRIVEQGSSVELRANPDSAFQEIAAYVSKEEYVEEKEDGKPKEASKTQRSNDKEKGKLTSKETKSEGSVNWRHYRFYLQSMTVWKFTVVCIIFLVSEAFKVGGNLVLADWTENFDLPEAYTNWSYIGFYTLLALGTTLTGMGSQIGCQFRAAEASRKIHHSLLDKTMHAPMIFFDTTPTGRILNRFSSDLDMIDAKIPVQLKNFLSCLTMILGTFVVVTGVTPWFLVPVVPIGICYVFLQRYFTKTRRQVTRLQAIAKSPIFSHFSETINGVATIRAFNQQNRFFEESDAKVSKHLVCNYICDMTNRWLSIRVEVLGNIIVFFAAAFAFYSRDTLSAGVIGLSISYSMQMIDGFGWTIRMAGELESDSVAIERVREYEDLPQEAGWDTQGGLEASWPQRGEIEFAKYSTKYRPELDNVLNNFNLRINAGDKVGLVGRTGAGKSSLSLAMFRIIEAVEGSIRIDDRQVSGLGLQDLRSRLTIIPQEPTIFSGSLRFNLDPGDVYPDEAVHAALQTAGLGELIKGFTEGLYHQVSEGGAGFSLGEKQLICLARALLRRSKVLVLDEATAAVDTHTDDKIQETLRTEFADCTVVTIAHRLHTVTGGDLVIVLDRGSVLEAGHPDALLADSNTHFYQMARAAGIVQ